MTNSLFKASLWLMEESMHIPKYLQQDNVKCDSASVKDVVCWVCLDFKYLLFWGLSKLLILHLTKAGPRLSRQ